MSALSTTKITLECTILLSDLIPSSVTFAATLQLIELPNIFHCYFMVISGGKVNSRTDDDDSFLTNIVFFLHFYRKGLSNLAVIKHATAKVLVMVPQDLHSDLVVKL